jgi:NAD(P)-dependent dehydrogenase (short-subunit alcohol dehydrogenase family)
MSIAGKTYIVTGGTKGFGLAIAQALLAAGAKVGIIARSAEPIAKLQQEIGADKLFGAAADISNREQVFAAVQKIHAHFGSLDGIVNNAGIALPGRIEDHLLLPGGDSTIGCQRQSAHHQYRLGQRPPHERNVAPGSLRRHQGLR